MSKVAWTMDKSGTKTNVTLNKIYSITRNLKETQFYGENAAYTPMFTNLYYKNGNRNTFILCLSVLFMLYCDDDAKIAIPTSNTITWKLPDCITEPLLQVVMLALQ